MMWIPSIACALSLSVHGVSHCEMARKSLWPHWSIGETTQPAAVPYHTTTMIQQSLWSFLVLFLFVNYEERKYQLRIERSTASEYYCFKSLSRHYKQEPEIFVVLALIHFGRNETWPTRKIGRSTNAFVAPLYCRIENSNIQVPWRMFTTREKTSTAKSTIAMTFLPF